jgi:pimeloyl-ACP methyl ester carboxylesterase
MRDATTMLQDGRTLAYAEIGSRAPDAPVVLYFHGAPSTRLDLADADGHLVKAHVRVIAADRPGYGGSSPHRGRSMLDHVHDVVALADQCEIERFAVVGYSNGAPYALACAATAPDRVHGVAIAAGTTDFAWREAWDGFHVQQAEVMRMPDVDAAVRWCVEQFGDDGTGFLGLDLAPAELQAIEASPDGAVGTLESVLEAFRQGVAGYAEDVWLGGRPWPFDPAAISAPTTVYHGNVDAIVPLRHGEHTAELVPGAELVVWPGIAHLAVLPRVHEVVVAVAGG